MPRIPDEQLRSPAFKGRIHEADEYAAATGLDKWGCRIVWIALTYGTVAALQYASKNNRSSPPWVRFHRLVDVGIFSTDPEGIVWTPGIEPWESDSLDWFNTLVFVSVGGIPPVTFPRGIPK